IFVLRGETEESMRQMLYHQAERIAAQVELAETPAERLRLVRDLSRSTNLRITVAGPDTVFADVRGTQLLSDGRLFERSEMQVAAGHPGRLALRGEGGPRPVHYVALYRARAGLTVRVGQPEPPLFTLVKRMRIALIVGMTMALLLSLLGSWVAAYQVT